MGCGSSASREIDAGKIEGIQPFKGKYINEAKSKRHRKEARERYEALYADASCSDSIDLTPEGPVSARSSRASSICSLRSASRTASVCNSHHTSPPAAAAAGASAIAHEAGDGNNFLTASQLAAQFPSPGCASMSPTAMQPPSCVVSQAWDEDTMLYGSPVETRLQPEDSVTNSASRCPSSPATIDGDSVLSPARQQVQQCEDQQLRPVFVQVIEIDPMNDTNVVEEMLLTSGDAGSESPTAVLSPTDLSPAALLSPNGKPSSLGRCWNRHETIHGINSDALRDDPLSPLQTTRDRNDTSFSTATSEFSTVEKETEGPILNRKKYTSPMVAGGTKMPSFKGHEWPSYGACFSTEQNNNVVVALPTILSPREDDDPFVGLSSQQSQVTSSTAPGITPSQLQSIRSPSIFSGGGGVSGVPAGVPAPISIMSVSGKYGDWTRRSDQQLSVVVPPTQKQQQQLCDSPGLCRSGSLSDPLDHLLSISMGMESRRSPPSPTSEKVPRPVVPQRSDSPPPPHGLTVCCDNDDHHVDDECSEHGATPSHDTKCSVRAKEERDKVDAGSKMELSLTSQPDSPKNGLPPLTPPLTPSDQTRLAKKLSLSVNSLPLPSVSTVHDNGPAVSPSAGTGSGIGVGGQPRNNSGLESSFFFGPLNASLNSISLHGGSPSPSLSPSASVVLSAPPCGNVTPQYHPFQYHQPGVPIVVPIGFLPEGESDCKLKDQQARRKRYPIPAGFDASKAI